VNGRVLHADFIALVPNTPAASRQELVGHAAALASLPGVQAVVTIEAASELEFGLALLFVLDDRTALEGFGADTRYAAFLHKAVAPILETLAGVDVLVDTDFPQSAGYGACLALMAPEETYDWQVRAALTDWTNAIPGAAGGAIGLAVGERQRFRGLAVVFGDGPLAAGAGPGGFDCTLVSGRARFLP
jgi:hypothetical protein